ERGHVARRKDVGEKEGAVVGDVVRYCEQAKVGVRHSYVLGLAAVVPAKELRVPKESGRGVPIHWLDQLCIGIGLVAQRHETLATELAGSACDHKGNDDAI